MALVSVIIPTFNRAYCIARTIDSALNQTYQNTEVIVVDDGSTDNTSELINSLYAKESRVVYIRQANTGVSGARNAGFAAARGDFVALLDSDDIWMPWKLELQVACLQRFPEIGMVWSDMEAIDVNGQVTNLKYIRTMYSGYSVFTMDELFSHQCALKDLAGATPFTPALTVKLGDAKFYSGSIFSQMVMGSIVHTSTTLLRRERLEKVGGFNVDLKFSGEDFDFHLRTCHEGLVGFVDLSTIQYQRGMPDALTRPEYEIHVANNFLKTILPVINNNRAEIKLPDATIHIMLAGAYKWLADTQLKIGDFKAARKNILTSMRYKFWQPRIFTLLVLAYLPKSILQLLRAMKRRAIGKPSKQR